MPKEQIGKTGYVTAREPVFFCPAQTVGFNGCRKLTAGKITITSTGHEAWLPNMGGGLKSPAELPGIREVLYGVKLNDKEDGFSTKRVGNIYGVNIHIEPFWLKRLNVIVAAA